MLSGGLVTTPGTWGHGPAHERRAVRQTLTRGQTRQYSVRYDSFTKMKQYFFDTSISGWSFKFDEIQPQPTASRASPMLWSSSPVSVCSVFLVHVKTILIKLKIPFKHKISKKINTRSKSLLKKVNLTLGHSLILTLQMKHWEVWKISTQCGDCDQWVSLMYKTHRRQ